jgi:hypothetical protein
VKNAELLSPCHIQNSRKLAVFCGSLVVDFLFIVLDLFSMHVTFPA